MNTDELFDLMNELIYMRKSSDAKDAEISMWRERFLSNNPLMPKDPKKTSYVWYRFLSCPSSIMAPNPDLQLQGYLNLDEIKKE